MAVSVKKIVLWRAEAGNQPGALARVLQPPAMAGSDLNVVMGYRHGPVPGQAAIEIFPIAGRKAMAAASAAGFQAAAIPTLLVEGDNKPGLGFRVAQALGAAGINMAFFMAQVIGRKFAAIIGLETEDDARKALPLLRKATKA